MGFSAFFVAYTIISVAYARNNWNQACLSGSCSYDLDAHRAKGASGTIKIWGSEGAISDITAAAGWEILDCDRDKLSQEIRLVCRDEESSGCAHLYSGHGAVDTLVRLPESCGQGPFARVARSWVSEDQSIPQHIASRIVRRDGQHPEVKALQLDTDFAKADVSKTGPVYFALLGANFAGAESEGDLVETHSRHSQLTTREEFDEFTSRAVDSISAWWWPFDWPKAIPFSLSSDPKTGHLNIKNNLLNMPAQEKCAVTAALKVDVSVNADVTVKLSVSGAGTIFPPEFKSFNANANANGKIGGSLNLNANVAGTLESPKKRIGQPVGLPGLSYPGILTIGPYLALDGKADAKLDLDVNLVVGVDYNFNATLAIPPKKAGSSFTLNPVDTPLQLSLTPSIKATGTVTAHLIPSVNIGIDAFAGFVTAAVYMNLDAQASMTLALQSTAKVTATKAGVTAKGPDFGGSFHIDAGLGLNAGATGSLFGLLSGSKDFEVARKDFELYRKDFGSKAAARVRSARFISILDREAWEVTNTRRELGILKCPSKDNKKPQSVGPQGNKVAAKDIRPKKAM